MENTNGKSILLLDPATPWGNDYRADWTGCDPRFDSIYSFQEKFFGVILHMLVLSHHKSRRRA